jgi:hypothetical protein
MKKTPNIERSAASLRSGTPRIAQDFRCQHSHRRKKRYVKQQRYQFDVARSVFGVQRFLILLFISRSVLAQEETTSGYGPPTSVSVERSMTARAALPPRNWIDQTRS